MIVVAAVLFCFASGFLVARLGWSIEAPATAAVILNGSLAAGFGLGIFSVVYFVSRVAGFQHLLLADLGVFIALLIACFLIRPRATAVFTPHGFTSVPRWVERALTLAFLVALAAVLYTAILRTLAFPHGDGWDAFSIWNLRARFLFFTGQNWHETFSSLIPWSHPDYPLLLPGGIAHFWTLVGRDDPRVPATIAFVFTFATVGLLFSTLRILRGRNSSMLGSLTLLATPAFIEQGTAQYADVPLSFFFLATVALFCLDEESAESRNRLAVLAGLAAAFSTWTKNEGLLFLAAMLAGQILIAIRFRSKTSDAHTGTPLRAFALFFAGALPILLVLLYFKHSIAGPGDLFTGGSSALQKLLEPARYWAVLQWFVKDFFRFGRWLLIPGTVLLAGFYLAPTDGVPERSRAMRSSAIALLLTLAGYAAIYLITPRDLYWHLRFSSDRLFLQLWPSAILLFFLRT
jgi:hypothetical protein